MEMVPENKPHRQPERRGIKGLAFELTCGACPEQYDVWYKGAKVAYVRFRHNQLTVEVPFDGIEVLREKIEDFPDQGVFSSEEQRTFWLEKAAELIKEELRRGLKE